MSENTDRGARYYVSRAARILLVKREQATLLRLLMVAIASINSNNYSLPGKKLLPAWETIAA